MSLRAYEAKGISWVTAAILGILVMTATAALAQTEPAKALRVSGAAMASNQVETWAQEFMQANPGSRIVVSGSSAGKGFQAIVDGDAEIAMLSRLVLPEEEKKSIEKGIKLENRQIGFAGVAVITSANNPVGELTVEQLRKIFSGDWTNWKEAGGPDAPIRVFTRRVPASGGATFFQERVLHPKTYGPAAIYAETFSSIRKACGAATDLPVGIIPAWNLGNGTIKVMGVKEDAYTPGVVPSEDTLKNKSYPIILAFRFYWDGRNQNETLRKFVEYCASKGLPEAKP